MLVSAFSPVATRSRVEGALTIDSLAFVNRARVVTAIAVATVSAVIASVAVGTRDASIVDVAASLLERSDTDDLYILIRDERIPRTVAAILVGAAMAVAGAVIQGHTRNPLADPGILGISHGAGFAAVLAVMLFGVQSAPASVAFGMVGAALSAALVFWIGSVGGGRGNPLSLILAGAALTALFVSATTAVVLSNKQSLNQYRFWSAGTLVDRGYDVVVPAAVPIVIGLGVALAIAPALNALATGDETAAALGIAIPRIRLLAFLSVALLTGAASAAVGPLVFVGLVVPHLVRAVTGPDHRMLLPLCIPVGATLVLVSDVLARVVLRPAELPVGVVLAFVGVPCFVWFVRNRKPVAA